jgi:hypothetical protein
MDIRFAASATLPGRSIRRRFRRAARFWGLETPSGALAGGFVQTVKKLFLGSDLKVYESGDKLPEKVTIVETIGSVYDLTRDSFYYTYSMEVPEDGAWLRSR